MKNNSCFWPTRFWNGDDFGIVMGMNLGLFGCTMIVSLVFSFNPALWLQAQAHIRKCTFSCMQNAHLLHTISAFLSPINKTLQAHYAWHVCCVCVWCNFVFTHFSLQFNKLMVQMMSKCKQCLRSSSQGTCAFRSLHALHAKQGLLVLLQHAQQIILQMQMSSAENNNNHAN